MRGESRCGALPHARVSRGAVGPFATLAHGPVPFTGAEALGAACGDGSSGATMRRVDKPPFLGACARPAPPPGYDSAGVCVVNDHGDKEADLYLCKKKGKVSNLRDAMDGNVKGTCARLAAPARQQFPRAPTDSTACGAWGPGGIAHTRWATHGPPNDVNAHPHVSAGGRIAVVHNGILENFSDLRQFVTGHGIALQSDTDTEVLVHLIELAKRGQLTTHKSDQSPGVRLPLHKAVAVALSQVDGTFGLAVVRPIFRCLLALVPWALADTPRCAPPTGGRGRARRHRGCAQGLPAAPGRRGEGWRPARALPRLRRLRRRRVHPRRASPP